MKSYANQGIKGNSLRLRYGNQLQPESSKWLLDSSIDCLTCSGKRSITRHLMCKSICNQKNN